MMLVDMQPSGIYFNLKIPKNSRSHKGVLLEFILQFLVFNSFQYWRRIVFGYFYISRFNGTFGKENLARYNRHDWDANV